ncbi:cyanoexosortase A system-associated protein [Trichothermofontia sp.]
MLTTWRQRLPWRTVLLAVTLMGSWGVVGKVWLVDLRQPIAPTPLLVPVALPDAPPLPGWQLTQSTPIAIALIDGSRASHAYHFQRDNQVLTIHIHYLAPWTDGNNSRFLFVNTALRTANAQLQARSHPETGFYGVLTTQGRAYLTACINPQGKSTITQQQTAQNRYTTGLRLGRVLRWLLGQGALLDGRCLWTLMAIPLTPVPASLPKRSEPVGLADGLDPAAPIAPITPEQAYAILESAWVPWHRWWQEHFPPPVPKSVGSNSEP